MSDIDFTSAEARRVAGQEGAIIEKPKNFLTSALRWSFALVGAKEFLMDQQVPLGAFSIALIVVFGIRSLTTRSNLGMAFINFAFLILGWLIVGIAMDPIIMNSYIKWVIYGLFIVMVAINPDYQQTFQEMQQIFKSMCGATSSRLRNLFSQVRMAIQNRGESPVSDNPATISGDGGILGDENV